MLKRILVSTISSFFMFFAAAAAYAAPVPLHRLSNASVTNYFYTTFDSDVSVAINTYGYTYEGVAGYCEPNVAPYGQYAETPFGSVQLTRYWKGPPQIEHFYTTDQGERNYVTQIGYVFEGNECQLSSTQTTNTVPFHRMTKFFGETGDLVHFYTVSYAEIQTKANDGFAYEGIVGYILTSPTAPNFGFWDNGFTYPKVRTEYDAITNIANINPNCRNTPAGFLFGPAAPECLPEGSPSAPNYSVAYATSNAWSQYIYNWNSYYDPNYWVLVMNNEPRNDTGCNSGPPDVSLPRSQVGAGIFGFDTIYDGGWTARLDVNFSSYNPCNSAVGHAFPYLEFGAQQGRGNPWPLAGINPTLGVPHTLRFKAKVDTFSPATLTGVQTQQYVRLLLIATWPNASGVATNRLIFINLFGRTDIATDVGSNEGWKWPYVNSFFHPGGELAFYDAAQISNLCGMYLPTLVYGGSTVDYKIDVNNLFQCASTRGWFSNAVPVAPNVAVTGIHWAVEGQGDTGRLGASIKSISMGF